MRRRAQRLGHDRGNDRAAQPVPHLLFLDGHLLGLEVAERHGVVRVGAVLKVVAHRFIAHQDVALARLRIFRTDLHRGCLVHCQGMSQGASQIPSIDDGVDKPVIKREFRGLETLRQLLADGVADDALAGEADERVRLGYDDVAVHGERRGDAAGRRVGDDRDIRQMRGAVALKGARGFRHLHEGYQALLHARAARRREDDDRKVLFGGALEQARHLLAHHVAHRPHEKRRLHDADGHAQAGDGAHARAHGLLEPRLLALGLELVQVTGELQRVGLGEHAVPFLKRPGIEQVVDALGGVHAQILAAARAHVMARGEARAVELQLAMLARAPCPEAGRVLVGGAQNPAEMRGVAQRREDADALGVGAGKERVDLRKRRGLLAEQDDRCLAGVRSLEHGVAVGEQGVAVLLAEAHLAVRELEIGLAAAILRVGGADGKSDVFGGEDGLLRQAPARHHQRHRP